MLKQSRGGPLVGLLSGSFRELLPQVMNHSACHVVRSHHAAWTDN